MKFSIITATYNSDRFILKNIESVKKQTHSSWEHIFVDGFSSDKTKQIILDYKKQFPNQVRLIESPPKGISNAMNVGIKNATGDYLIHLHSDDSLFDDNVLKDTNQYLEKNDFDWIYGKSNIIESDGSKIGVWPHKKIHKHNSKSFFGKQLIKYMNFIPHQTVFIKPDVFQKFGSFDETLKTSMDSDLWMRIINKTKWSFFDKTICNFTVRKDAESSNLQNKKRNKINYAQVQKRHLNKIEYVFGRFIENTINLFFNNYR
jgi:glycosyltransferase involved in cell wall biosynthesis